MKKNDIYSNDIKLAEETKKYKIYCKCGHPLVIYPFEHRNYKICSWCGYKVFKDKEEQEKYNFKQKMKGLLKK